MLTSIVSRDLQPENIPDIFVTLDVLNPLTSAVSRNSQPENIPDIFVTFEVSNALRSTFFRDVHLAKRLDISVTCEKSQWSNWVCLQDTSSRLYRPASMPDILVIPLILKTTVFTYSFLSESSHGMSSGS